MITTSSNALDLFHLPLKTHTHTHTHTQTLSLTHTHTHTLSLSNTLKHTLTSTILSLSLSHTHTHTTCLPIICLFFYLFVYLFPEIIDYLFRYFPFFIDVTSDCNATYDDIYLLNFYVCVCGRESVCLCVCLSTH